MINPVIHTFNIFGFEFSLRWYGVIVMLGVIVGSLIVEREIKRRGENGDRIWDALIWVIPIGIVGARLWYVAQATIDGSRYYIENPLQIINIPQGGLHIYGGLLFGAIVLLWYLKKNQLDAWLFLDAAGPALLVGQGIGRIANFINQELYGPPTTLPWGIPISLAHRLPEYRDLSEAARFHPTFAYEMLWKFAVAGFLIWLSRRYEKEFKPGTIFAAWLMLAGVGRVWIEYFRPDQPKIETLDISYTAVVAGVMTIAGAVLLLIRYKALNPAFAENWQEEYQIAGREKEIEEADEPVENEPAPVKKKTPRTKTKVDTEKKPARKSAPRKTPAATKKTPAKKTTTRTKKSS